MENEHKLYGNKEWVGEIFKQYSEIEVGMNTLSTPGLKEEDIITISAKIAAITISLKNRLYPEIKSQNKLKELWPVLEAHEKQLNYLTSKIQMDSGMSSCANPDKLATPIFLKRELSIMQKDLSNTIFELGLIKPKIEKKEKARD